jgi:hypothetical protein
MNTYLNNFLKLFTLLSSWFVGALVLFTSLINNDLKWFSTLTSAMITLLIAARIPNPEEKKPSPPQCHLVFSNNNSAFDLNILFISHVASFMLTPLFSSSGNSKDKGIGLIIFFIITILGTLLTRMSNNCNTMLSIILGLAFGLASGALWYKLIKDRISSDLVYFQEDDSTSEQCYRSSSGQNFKCSVYKNGELIQNL